VSVSYSRKCTNIYSAKLAGTWTWDQFLFGFFDYIKKTYQNKITEYKTVSGGQTISSHSNHYGDQGAHDVGFDMDALMTSASNSALQAAETQTNGDSAQNTSLYGAQYTSGKPIVSSQSLPTAELYEMARRQAASKNSSNNRRDSGGVSARRPWSTAEERALMAGLDSTGGPHWSQILSLYGANGSVSTILQHRNQVQLKDKARNLKLFFLKNGTEVPFYLSQVTGELKTRAPSQAARQAAEARERLGNEEETARFDSIMALSAGLQDPVSHDTRQRIKPRSRSGSRERMDVIDTAHADAAPVYDESRLAGLLKESIGEVKAENATDSS
jgi:hypothetical protein